MINNKKKQIKPSDELVYIVKELELLRLKIEKAEENTRSVYSPDFLNDVGQMLVGFLNNKVQGASVWTQCPTSLTTFKMMITGNRVLRIRYRLLNIEKIAEFDLKNITSAELVVHLSECLEEVYYTNNRKIGK